MSRTESGVSTHSSPLAVCEEMQRRLAPQDLDDMAEVVDPEGYAEVPLWFVWLL